MNERDWCVTSKVSALMAMGYSHLYPGFGELRRRCGLAMLEHLHAHAEKCADAGIALVDDAGESVDACGVLPGLRRHTLLMFDDTPKPTLDDREWLRYYDDIVRLDMSWNPLVVCLSFRGRPNVAMNVLNAQVRSFGRRRPDYRDFADRLRRAVGNPFRPIQYRCPACGEAAARGEGRDFGCDAGGDIDTEGATPDGSRPSYRTTRQGVGGPGTGHYLRECRLRTTGKSPGTRVGVDPAWMSPDVIRLVRLCTREPDRAHFGLLADALQDAGCDQEQLLMPLLGKRGVPKSGCKCFNNHAARKSAACGCGGSDWYDDPLPPSRAMHGFVLLHTAANAVEKAVEKAKAANG